jgi:hypothetical protein
MRKIAAGFFIAGLFTISCNKNQNLTSGCINFQSYLKVPWVIMAGSAFNLQVSACKLISSNYVIAGSPGFVYDRASGCQFFLKDIDEDEFIMVTKHENTRALSQFHLDKNPNPVKDEYIVNTHVGLFRLWEWGAMIDISDEMNVPGTTLVNIHARSRVEGGRFLNPGKTTSVQSYSSGSQTLIRTGVPS